MKFWDMTVDEYKQFLEELETRSKKLDSFESEIVKWLRKYPDLSAAQILDWLQEYHPGLEVAESTVRNLVQGLRLEYSIPKVMRIRQYEAVEELPIGRQMQVDFGNPNFDIQKANWLSYGSSPLSYRILGINTHCGRTDRLQPRM